MPEMDGFQVLERIRDRPRMCAAPVVMLTAQSDKSSVVKSLELGASDYLVKPFSWPVARARIERLLAANIGGFAGSRSLECTEKVNALIVDDDELNRDLLTRRLRAAGHEVLQASGADEALKVLENRKVDLIMLDIMMPGVDGFALLQQIKTTPAWAEIPVLMISALEDSDTMARCLEGGADDYVIKPYHALVLAKRIESCLLAGQLRTKEKSRRQRLLEFARLGKRIRTGADTGDEGV